MFQEKLVRKGRKAATSRKLRTKGKVLIYGKKSSILREGSCRTAGASDTTNIKKRKDESGSARPQDNVISPLGPLHERRGRT